MDRFYSSPSVFLTLESLGFGTCGTCRNDRLRINEEMSTKINSLRPRESCYFRSGNLLLCVWYDPKLVYTLTTMHSISNESVERRTF